MTATAGLLWNIDRAHDDDLPKPECGGGSVGGLRCKHTPLVELLPHDHPGMFRVLYCAQHATTRIAELLRERGVQ